MASRIVVVGGSFGGLAAIKQLVKLTENTARKVDITLIEPRQGFINVMAMPKAVMDPGFAKDSYVEIQELGLVWNSIKTIDGDVNKYKSVLSHYTTKKHQNGLAGVTATLNPNVSLNYVQGYVTKLHKDKVEYSIGKLTKKQSPEEFNGSEAANNSAGFDYCILGSGRARNWPFDPIGYSKEEFGKEMSVSAKEISNAKSYNVIGAGALGIELAGELKAEFKEKKLSLIHPYLTLPPEPLVPQTFKEELLNMLKDAGISLELGKRVKKVGSDLVLFSPDTEEVVPLEGGLDYWCNYHKNNLDYLRNSEEFKDVIVNNDETLMNSSLQLTNPVKNITYENIFSVGDLVNIPVIKAAGGAYRLGVLAADNIWKHLAKEELEEFPLKTWPKSSMVITVGSDKCVLNNINNEIILNDPATLEIYKDYRNENIFTVFGFEKK